MLNCVVISGRLVRDPEYRTLDNGTGYCNFTLAVDDDYKDKDGNKVTDFIDCTAWRQTAEYIVKYQAKGNLLEVRGRLKSRKWTDKDGNKRTSWFVQADSAYGVGGKKENQTGNAYQTGNTYQGGYQTGANYAAPSPAYTQTAIEPGAEYAVLTDDDAKLPF